MWTSKLKISNDKLDSVLDSDEEKSLRVVLMALRDYPITWHKEKY